MFDSDFIANPYKTYNHLRTAAPLHWADKFRSGAWLVTRYADMLAGLHDPRLSSKRSHTLTAALPSKVQGEFGTFNEIFSRWMLFLDPPHHTRLRKLLNKEFTPNMIQRMRRRIQQAVNTLLDQALGKTEMEFMTEFANRHFSFRVGQSRPGEIQRTGKTGDLTRRGYVAFIRARDTFLHWCGTGLHGSGNRIHDITRSDGQFEDVR